MLAVVFSVSLDVLLLSVSWIFELLSHSVVLRGLIGFRFGFRWQWRLIWTCLQMMRG